MSDIWSEYDETAAWLARQRRKGVEGDPLPDTISETVENLIDEDVEAFGAHVGVATDLLSMEERSNEVNPVLASEDEAVLGARLAGTREIAQPKLELPNLILSADIGAFSFEPAKPRIPEGQRRQRQLDHAPS